MDIISKSAYVWLLPLFLQRIHDQNSGDGAIVMVLKCVGIQAVVERVWFGCWDVHWHGCLILFTQLCPSKPVQLILAAICLCKWMIKDVFIFGFLGILNGGFSLAGLLMCYFKTMLPLSYNLWWKVNKTNCSNRAMESSREISTGSPLM